MNYKLRPWNLNDLESLVECANNPAIAKFMTDAFPYPYTRDKGKAFIEFANNRQPVLIFAIEVEGKAVGGIGLHPQSDIHQKSAELGYWLAEKYWGKGIITSAVKQMINTAFSTLDINRLYARPFGTNIASQKVLEKAGFVKEAVLEKAIYKNGEFLDELIFVIRR